jgi:hypothetical protein
MTKDWRLEHLETQPYLRGAAFTRKPYRAYSATWEHDHCAGCWAKFMEPPAEELHEGYATTEPISGVPTMTGYALHVSLNLNSL